MKQRIPTLNEFVDQGQHKQSLPFGKQTFAEQIIVLEFPHSASNDNFNNLVQTINNVFGSDSESIRIEQDYGEMGGMTRAIVHIKDMPENAAKFDEVMNRLKFNAKLIDSKKVE